jgi:DNA-directed RNA polymerase specialized sigma24 family protein
VVAHLEVNNLAELTSALSPSSGRLSRHEAAAVIAAMLRGADADVLIPRAIIQALIPGVLALSQRLDTADGPWCDLDAFYADAISALWELTTSWSGTHRPYAAGDLLSAVRTRLRTLQSSERRHRSRQSGTPGELDTVSASIGRTGEELLAAALAEAPGHGLKVADAAVLYATRVLGMSLAEVAQLAGIPPGKLRYRRQIAIDRLVA